MNVRSGTRLFILKVLVVSLFATLLSRLWYLQVLGGDSYTQQASSNRVRAVVTPAARGDIVDDTGRKLVDNKTVLVVSVDRSVLVRQHDGGKAVLRRLAVVLGVPEAELVRRTTLCGPDVSQPCWNGSPYQPIPVDERTTNDQALAILEHSEDFPGVTAQPEAVREYPQGGVGANTAHVLGYLAPISDKDLSDSRYAGYPKDALIGASGLEFSYDKALRGTPGVRRLAVDRSETVTGEIDETAPVRGDTLVTSIDARVQKAVEDSLQKAVAQARTQTLYCNHGTSHCPADSAAGVVLDVRTGHVIALASYPAYDPSVWTGGISARDYQALTSPAAGIPLVDRATQGQFAPGSTFKLISTAAAVQDGEANFNGTYDCPSSYTVANRTYRNFEGTGGDAVTLHSGIVVSCDTEYYAFGYQAWSADQKLISAGKQPAEDFVRMAQAFGLGSKTGIDLPGESTGRIAGRAFKKASWEQLKTQYCAGAKNQAFTAQHREADQEFCDTGYIYEPGDAANFAVGQGDTVVTPLQLATAYAALANGGTVFEPTIGKALVSPDGRTSTPIKAGVKGHLPVPADTLAQIRSAMADVIADPHGTGNFAFQGFPLDKVAVGGKTGTAEVVNKQDTSWFVSFGPVADPRYVVLVMVSQAGQGGLTAAPAVRRIWDRLYGFDGKPAALRNGQLPTGLPKLNVTVIDPSAHPGASPASPGAASPASPGPASPGTPGVVSTTGAIAGAARPTGSPQAGGFPPALFPHRRSLIRAGPL